MRPTAPSSTEPAPLRVRTIRRQNHHFRLGIDLGQRNARFVARTMTLRRLAGWMQAFALVPEPGYDLVHSWNAVPLLTRRPYVISFESFLPRVPEDTYIGWLERALQRRLLADVRRGRCLALLAISEFGRRQFRSQNRGFAGREVLEERMGVLYPAPGTGDARPKRHSDRLSLLFVGFDFMRKGGAALLRAHERLRSQGLPVETTVVSALQWSEDDYVGPPSREYVEQELSRLGADGVTHHRWLANADVLELMRRSDYFVFPTMHDTFGYVAVEALSRGTPVVATATCALPEIVEDGACGFLLGFDNDELVGRWRHIYRTSDPGYLDRFEEATERIAGELVETLATCWERRSDYEALSAGALERVRTRFSRDVARDRLEQIYELARR